MSVSYVSAPKVPDTGEVKRESCCRRMYKKWRDPDFRRKWCETFWIGAVLASLVSIS
jgi:hypothetical protein